MVIDDSSGLCTFETAETIYQLTRRNIHDNDLECLKYFQLLKTNVLHVACFVVSSDTLHGVTVPKTASPFFDTTPVRSLKNCFDSNSQQDTHFTVILSQLPLTDSLLSVSALSQKS
jgi:hypothetical protein